MATVQIPFILTKATGAPAEVVVTGDTVSQAFAELFERYPAAKQQLCWKGDAIINPSMAIFVDGQRIRSVDDVTPLRMDSEMMIVQAIAGG